MLRNYLNRLKSQREEGSADMVAALVLTPIVIFLLIGVINAGLWLNTKAHIEAATRDGTRLAAMWGGSGNTRLNTTGKTTANIISEKIYADGSCTTSHCTRKPSVSCTLPVASSAGQTVQCTVTYYYKSIPGAQLFGFVPSSPIVYTSTAITETGYRS